MLYLTFFFTITLLISSLLLGRKEKRDKVKRRISLATQSEIGAVNTFEESVLEKKKQSFLLRTLQFILRQFKRSFQKKMAEDKEERLELKILQAGRPFNMIPVDFQMLRISLAIVLPLLFGFYAKLLHIGLGVIIAFSVTGFILGLTLPGFYLRVKAKKRSHLALRELPDVLDLLTVSLEAGLGFDSSLSKLVSKKVGILPTEFHRCLEEIRLGRTRRDALIGVRDRIVLAEIKVLISSILQAEKMGIGMVQVLRVQSQEVREQRKQRAEEQAMKAPIKMMFPLVLFIFPTLFIVLLGPAVIQFMETFSK